LDTRWDWATFGVSLIWSSKTEAVRSITASLFFFFQTATASRVINILLVYTRGKYPVLMLRWQLSGRRNSEITNKRTSKLFRVIKKQRADVFHQLSLAAVLLLFRR
jgi:hypothetical protein